MVQIPDHKSSSILVKGDRGKGKATSLLKQLWSFMHTLLLQWVQLLKISMLKIKEDYSLTMKIFKSLIF